MTSRNKGQEEMVGFAVIMVILVVAIVIFISFSISRETPSSASREIETYLSGLNELTTECILTSGELASTSELLRACYSKKNCKDGQFSCTLLNKTLSNAFNASFVFGNSSRFEGLDYLAVYSSNLTNKNIATSEILSIKLGNCSSQMYRQAQDFILVSPGSIRYSLKVCLSKYAV